MWEKVKKWFLSHPLWVIIIIFLVLPPILVIMPEWVTIGMAALLCCAFLIFAICTICKDRKERKALQNMTPLDMKEKWKEYVNIVNSTLQKQKEPKTLDDSWIEIFHSLMHSIAGNSYYIKRKLNDFDIASFLIYSLTWNHKEKDDILFAFECAKKVMSNPKVYIRHINLGGELSLEVEGTISEIKSNSFDEKITEEMTISIIERYLNQRSSSKVVQLSDFLYTLYKKP